MGGATIPLSWYLILGAALFCVGVYGTLANRNLIVIMMSIEIMLNAVVLNLVAFARFIEPARTTGKVFAIVLYATAAAEAALGLALIISIWRTENTVAVEEIDLLQG
ncbi:MAG: NADH-quinone oxidoreductase subunit NuoK [Anaerolineae bacterium]|nr:NADH-quinone oxidoreductase subunit NuoK [Anaerolineae bacterium]